MRTRHPLSFLLVAITLTAQAQVPDDFMQFNAQRERTSATSMLVLGGWAVGNLVAGGVGMATTPSGSEAFHFHQMNAAWNVVNLGIAVPAYLGAKKRLRGPSTLDIPGTFDAQRKVEAVYLINTGLDLAYMGAGLWLWENGRGDPAAKRSEMFQGFGTSLLLQGGFLFVYDLANYIVHARHWKRSRAGLWQHLQFNGTSIRYAF